MKIAFVSHAYNLPGRIFALRPLGEHADVLVVGPLTIPGGRLLADPPIRVAGLPTLRLAHRRVVIYRGLAKQLRDFAPDVVCVDYDPWQPAFVQAMLAVTRMRTAPAFVLITKKNTFRGPDTFFGRVKAAIVTRSLSRVDRVVASSEISRSMYQTAFRVPDEQIVVQPHLPLDTDRFSPSPLRSPGPLRLGFVGKLGDTKGVPELLEAFAMVRASSPSEITLELVGTVDDGELLQRIEDQAGVTYRGTIPNTELQDFYRSIDVFLMPARILPDHQEHDGRAVLEAMASGLPCAVSDSGILPELVSEDEGWIFRAGDVADLRATLERVVSSSDLRQLGANARRRAIATVSAEGVANSRLQLFRQLRKEKNMSEKSVNYTAREEYQSAAVARDYIPRRFSGAMGRYRYRREQAAVNAIIAAVPAREVSAILDCPTGIGRWLPNLATLAPTRIVGVDVSPAMLARARETKLPTSISTQFLEGVAESLPFADSEFDLAFCHALFKHFPKPAQEESLAELARVSSKYVIVSLSLYRGPSGLIRRLRRAKGAYAVTTSWFNDSVRRTGLSVVTERKASTPLGVEYTYLLRKG